MKLLPFAAACALLAGIAAADIPPLQPPDPLPTPGEGPLPRPDPDQPGETIAALAAILALGAAGTVWALRRRR